MKRRAANLVKSLREKRGQSPRLRERAQVRALKNRVTRLESEVQELRRLNRRTAEIADVVQEVLVPAANRDDERVRRLLDDYRDAL